MTSSPYRERWKTFSGGITDPVGLGRKFKAALQSKGKRNTTPTTEGLGYRPLEPGQIRIVVLERRTPESRIRRYRLHTIGLVPTATEYGSSIEESLAGTKGFCYSALSYTWGDSRSKVPFQITDGKSNKTFTIEVTVNTIKALEQSALHWSGTTIPFWVDQVCIDQSSSSEKSSQVSMMRDIYKCATDIYVWLGDPTHDSGLAFSTIKEHYTQFLESLNTNLWVCDAPQQIGEESLVDAWHMDVSTKHEPSRALKRTNIAHAKVSNHRASPDPAGSGELRVRPPNSILSTLALATEGVFRSVARDDPQKWQAITNLLQRPYFERAWIRQEITAIESDEVLLYSGSSRVEWTDLKVFLGAALRSGVEHTEPTLSAQSVHQFELRRGEGATLLRLLEEIKSAEASDARDRLYSVVGCASDVLDTDLLLRPDYSQTTDEVFLSFVIWYIMKYRNLDFLGHVGAQANGWYWVPRWHGKSGAPFPKSVASTGPPLYSACGPWLDRLLINSCPYSLPLSLGIDGVRIARVGRVFKADDQGVNDFTAEREWLQDIDNTQCPLNDIPMHEVFAHTIVADSGWMGPEADPTRSRNAAVYIETDFDVRERILAKSRVKATTTGRSLFMTETDAEVNEPLLGIGPAWALPGDEIFMFKGGQVLYVVREVKVADPFSSPSLDCTGCESVTADLKSGDVIRAYVGECFMHGLMDGEILDMIGPESKREKPPALAGMDDDFKKYYLY